MSQKVAIIGSTGFIGRNIVAHLLQEGFDVTAVMRPGREKVFKDIDMRMRMIDNIAVESVDVVEKLSDIFVDHYAVFHLTYVPDYDVKIFERMNVIANRNVINAAMRAGVRKFITNSGLGVAHIGRKKETTNGYFRMKKRLEYELVKAWRTTGMRYIIFRPSYVIGKDDELTPMLVEKIRNGQTISVIGNGRYRMQPIFLKDVMQIYSMCLRSNDYDNQIFDLVGPKKIAYIDYIKLIGKFLHREPVVQYVPKAEAVTRKKDFGLNEDEIDVQLSDEVGDEKMLQKTFDFSLTPLEKAVEKIVEETI